MYLSWTQIPGIIFGMKTSHLLTVSGYRDNDWAGCKLDRNYTSGYVFKNVGEADSWNSRKQSTMTTFAAKVEPVALSSANLESLLNERIPTFLFKPFELSTKQTIDGNHTAVQMRNIDINGRHTPHINIKYHIYRCSGQKKGFVFLNTVQQQIWLLSSYQSQHPKSCPENINLQMGLE